MGTVVGNNLLTALTAAFQRSSINAEIKHFLILPPGVSSSTMKKCSSSDINFVFQYSKSKCKDLENALKQATGK